MNTTLKNQTVDIRPGVAILSILKYIEYDHWYAIAEFVDNAIDSYSKNQALLKEIEGDDYKLEVSIEIDPDANSITIRDNAAGIREEDFPRAFRAAQRPPDNTHLSEFGMGMKTASCWYTDTWSVRTTALGEFIEKTVRFDVGKIYFDNISELEVTQNPTSSNVHYTVIELTNTFRIPKGKTLEKVKKHIESIYRTFIRDGLLKLKFNGENLNYTSPKILEAPIYSDKDGEQIKWKKDINFDVEEGLSVYGFVAIRDQGSTSEAGLALFRRGRVIEGSYDQAFRPEIIFGRSNSYRSQRIFGELHLEGFQVSFTKKGFQADENMELFLELLHDELSDENFPMLKQAENYRVRNSAANYSRMATPVLKSAVSEMSNKLPTTITRLLDTPPIPAIAKDNQESLPSFVRGLHDVFLLHHNNLDWEISIELSYEESVSQMYEVGDSFIKDRSINTSARKIGIRLSLTHPFIIQYVDTDKSKLEPILRIIAALGLAEVIAKESASTNQREIRRNFNELINRLIPNS